MRASHITESQVEEAALEILSELGYETLNGPTIAPDGEYPERKSYTDVVLLSRLKEAIDRLNPKIPAEAKEEAIKKVLRTESPNLAVNNHDFHRLLANGIEVEYRKGERIAGDKVWLFDFERPHNNEFLAVNQFTVTENNHNRRFDIVLFVNGLPLAVIELKNPSDENATIWSAFNQLETYKDQIPSIFRFNEILVISDGMEARAGTITADKERFMLWRTVDGSEIESETKSKTMDVLLRGMFDKSIFIDLIRHFIVFEEEDKKRLKKLAGYHQYHAVNKAIEETIKASNPEGDKRCGVVWHTQGSGKSLTMTFYAGKMVLALDNPTIVVLTDRNDLDDQLFGTFSRCHELLRQEPVQAESREHIQELLKVASGGVVFTTIQKFFPESEELLFNIGMDLRNDLEIGIISDNVINEFGEKNIHISNKARILRQKNRWIIRDEKQTYIVRSDGIQLGIYARDDTYPTLSERRNIVVIADEAHRSQYDFIDGFARHIRDALPNASFIGFTGTPIEKTDRNTLAVFGDYIHIYDIQQAVRDGATVSIYYESRLARLELKESEKPKIDPEFEEVTEGEEVAKKERLKSKWARMEAIVGAEKRIRLIAKDIIEHFENRLSILDGKGMIVCMSRRICVDLYKEIVKLRPEWHDEDDKKGIIKVIMTGSASDPSGWQEHIRTKQARKEISNRMRDSKDPLKLVIVRDMWLTGFDAPSLHTMYIDKPMRSHGLMQAIARVNRVFKDKPGGLVVDYLGIADELKKALSEYTEGDRGVTGVPQEEAVAVMLEKYEIVTGILHGLNYKRFFNAAPKDRMWILADAMEHILKQPDGKDRFMKYTSDLLKAFALAVPNDEALKIRDEIGFFQTIRSQFIKATATKGKPTDELDYAIKQIVSKAVTTDKVIDIFDSVGLKKPDISILSDEFIAEIKCLPQKNLAFELLKKLLNDEIRMQSRKNTVQARSFAEMLENAIRKYQNKSIETARIIEELIELAKKMKEASKRGEQLNLNEDELAFYDALTENESAVQVLGDETLMDIAKELVNTVRHNVTIDWTLKESIQAKLRLLVKKTLRKYGYPPDKQARATELVLEQAGLLCKDWAEAYS